MSYKSLRDHEVLAAEFLLMLLEGRRAWEMRRLRAAGRRGAYHKYQGRSRTSVLLRDAHLLRSVTKLRHGSGARARTAQARFSAGRRRRTTVRFLGRTWPHVPMRYLSVGPCCRAPLLAICCCCCCRLGRGRCRPGVDHGSSGHKVTARWTASWITELSRSARVSATSCSSQDATKVTGPPGGSG